MKKYYTSPYNPAVKELSDFVIKQAQANSIRPDMLERITSVLDGIEITDRIITEKEQLLVQKEKEFKAFKASVDNNSKVARDVVNESKSNLDKAKELLNSGKFSEVLEYSNIALYNIGDINGFEVKGVEQANKLYLEKKQQYVEVAAKRDYFYNQGVINGVNAFSWVKNNPTRDFYSFFRDTLKISDKTPDNVNLIQNRLYKNLPKYLEESQRANSFYNEYNKYYDVKTKLEQVVNIHNIKASASKGLKDYEDALKSCDIALKIDPNSLILSNLKKSILQEKQIVEASNLEEQNLLVSQTQEIERLKALLVQKDELLTQKDIEKQELALQKDLEIQNKEQLLIQKDNEISGLNVQIQQLSHIDFGIQMTGNEVSTQVLEVDLAGLVEPQNVHELNL
jgi:hypothetical protein